MAQDFFVGDAALKGLSARIYLIPDFEFAAATWQMLPSLLNIAEYGKKKNMKDKNKSSWDCSTCGA